MAEYNFKFKQMNLWCNSHCICPCISNKQILSVTVIELDFVFYNKTVKDISKNVKNPLALKNFLHLSPLCIATFN